MPSSDRRTDEALEWVRRIDDPDFADWLAHHAWLEADPANRAAFDLAAMLIDEAAAGLAPALPAAGIDPIVAVNDNPASAPARRRIRRWLAAGVLAASAAALVAVIADRPDQARRAALYRVASGPAQRLIVRLGDGTQIALNADSAVLLDRSKPRSATLEHGQAFFAVRHEKDAPFLVHAGAATLQDVGTAFDVTRERGSIRIAVREGAILYDPAAAAIRLAAGKTIVIERGTATIGAIDPAAAGSWQEGRLVYRDSPFAVIAADMQRAIGRPVIAAPALEQRRFSGVIVVDPDRIRMFRRFGAIAGVLVRREGRGWRMDPQPR